MKSLSYVGMSVFFLCASNTVYAMDYLRNYFSSKKALSSPAPELKNEPHAIVEAAYTLEFGDNAYAMYEFDGRDNKLTCCWLDDVWAPVYIEYPGDEKKSYDIKNLIDRNGTGPSCDFDDSDSWKKLPGSDLRVYRFYGLKGNSSSVDITEHKKPIVACVRSMVEKLSHGVFLYQAMKFERENIVWRSPLIQLSKLIVMHTALPYFASCEENEVKGYSTSIFTNPESGVQETLFVIPIKALIPHLSPIAWHPTENKLLLNTDDDIISEFNGDSKKIEKTFPAKKVSGRYTYVPDTKQVIAIGAYGRDALYELRENEEPRELPISLVGHSEKQVVYNKIIDVVKNYIVLECMFSDNPRFLGVCDLLTNRLYNVHQFKTEQGSIVFDPNTLKMFEIGHRVYYTYPKAPAVYNRECSILKLELPSSANTQSNS